MFEMAPVAAGPEAAVGREENSGNVDMDDAARDLFGGSDGDEEPGESGPTTRPSNPRMRRDGAAPEPGAVEADSQGVRCPPSAEKSGGIMLEEHIEETENSPLKPLRNPKMPTQKEIEEHEISHCP